ncbi:MAG TPA: site-specific integrase [Acidimicrobiales bacterium]|jgi:integrase|nr:site-specific integrase [Acidimicrobiales bacterium]
MKGTKLERSPGVWRLRVFAGNDPKTGNPIQVSRTFKGTRRQADTALATFVHEVSRGLVPTTRSMPLSEYLEQWLDHITPTRSPTTIRGYKFKITRINERLGKVQLDKLTAQQLDRTYNVWLKEGLDPSSVHHLHRVLSAALRQAVKWGLLTVPPTALASPPPRRSHQKEIPSPDVVQQLIVTAEQKQQPILAAVIPVAATTGLRRGELAGLRWSDVDLDNGRLHVRRSIKNDIDGSWIAGAPKTHQTRRISLDTFTISVLKKHRLQAEAWAAPGAVELGPDAYVFTSDPSGLTPIRPDFLSSAFGRICKAAGVTGTSLHTLRHFSASMLVASGRDIRTIAGRLGHSDATTTLRVYAHMVEGRDQDAADFLGTLLASRQAPALDEVRPRQ